MSSAARALVIGSSGSSIAGACVVFLDQILKRRVLEEFQVGSSVAVIPGFLNITYARNSGAALGILKTMGGTLFYAAVSLAILAVFTYLITRIRPLNFKLTLALALVSGGAVGNGMDRYRLGYVVDFFDFHWHHLYRFPTFNLADAAIFLGVLYLSSMLLSGKPQEESSRASFSR